MHPDGLHWPPTGGLAQPALASAGPSPGGVAGTPPGRAPWRDRHRSAVPAAVPDSRGPCVDSHASPAALAEATARLGPEGRAAAIISGWVRTSQTSCHT